jgi:hypothetical protein
VRNDVNNGGGNDGPTSKLVEGYVAIERNDTIERGASKEGYEVAANREENEDYVDMKDKRRCPCNGESDAKFGPSILQIILPLIIDEAKSSD